MGVARDLDIVDFAYFAPIAGNSWEVAIFPGKIRNLLSPGLSTHDGNHFGQIEYYFVSRFFDENPISFPQIKYFGLYQWFKSI